MNCEYCDANIPPGATNCPGCGSVQRQAPPPPSFSPPSGSVFNPPGLPAGTPKSKIAAGLLGIFLGGLGIHNFYLGYTKRGVAQLLVFILGAPLAGLGPFIAWIWGLVEGIVILSSSQYLDAEGRPLVN